MKLKYDNTTYVPILGRSKYQPNGISCRVTKMTKKYNVHIKDLQSKAVELGNKAFPS